MRLTRSQLRRIILESLKEDVGKRASGGEASHSTGDSADSSSIPLDDAGTNTGEKTFGKISIKHMYAKLDMEDEDKKVEGKVSVTGGKFFTEFPMTFVHTIEKQGTKIDSRARVKAGKNKTVSIDQFEKKQEYFEKLKKVASRNGYNYFKDVMKKYAGLIIANNYDIKADANYLLGADIKVKEKKKPEKEQKKPEKEQKP